MICLMCQKETDCYWYSMNVPGDYCRECIDTVMNMHEFFERYNMELVTTLLHVQDRGFDFDHKKEC
jgi:hypothetical protein